MTAKTLKKLLGDAGAGLDESGGLDTLHDVLANMAKGMGVNAFQGTIATGIIGGMICNQAGKLVNLRTSVGTCGSADATVVQVHKNGVSQGSLSTDNAEADGTKKSLDLNVSVAVGDLITLVVSAAPTGGANLVASAIVTPVVVE